MFRGASSFNGDLSKWEVSGVTYMGCVCVGQGRAARRRCVLVCGCADTPPPFSFVCCRVRSFMFNGARSFHGDLSKWKVSAVTNMMCVCVAGESSAAPLRAGLRLRC